MNIEMQLLGYKGRLTHIFAREACPPWRKEDELFVHIEFDEPYPESIISTAISVPVREYSREEFLKAVKEEGERQLLVALERQREQREERQQRNKRREELDVMAKRLEELIEQ